MSLSLTKYQNKLNFNKLLSKIPVSKEDFENKIQASESRLAELQAITSNSNLTSEEKADLILQTKEK